MNALKIFALIFPLILSALYFLNVRLAIKENIIWERTDFILKDDHLIRFYSTLFVSGILAIAFMAMFLVWAVPR